MSIQKRSLVVVVLLTLASASYGIARYYSPSLIYHVVEQSLIQKMPAEVSKSMVRERLQAHLAAVPDSNARIKRLLQISEYLEKVQHLTSEEWDGLLPAGKPEASPVL